MPRAILSDMSVNMVSERNCKSLHAVLGKEDSLFDNAMIVTSKEIEDIMHSVAL